MLTTDFFTARFENVSKIDIKHKHTADVLSHFEQAWQFNWSGFVEQKLMLRSSFRRYQIHNCHTCYFGHTFCAS